MSLLLTGAGAGGSAPPPPPDPPTGLASSPASSTQLNFTWTPATGVDAGDSVDLDYDGTIVPSFTGSTAGDGAGGYGSFDPYTLYTSIRIRFVRAGVPGPWSADATGDTRTLLPAPANFSATYDGGVGEDQLSWDAVSGSTSYRCDTNNPPVTDVGGATSLTPSAAGPGTVYYLCAVGPGGPGDVSTATSV